MKLVNNLVRIYSLLNNNEKILRLLYYIPKDQFDDPLDPSKMDVSQLPEKSRIIEKLLVKGEKIEDLEVEHKLCRICLYSGPRDPQKTFLKRTNQVTDNPYLSNQQFIFDIYTPIDVNNMEFRLDWIGEALNEALFENDTENFENLRFQCGIPIVNTPKGYIGYRWIYIVTTRQDSKGFKP